VSKLAFIGSVDGLSMAGHLVTNGAMSYRVQPQRQGRGLGRQVQGARDTPAQAAEGSDIVFSCVGDDPDLREITLGPKGAFEDGKGAIFVDHTRLGKRVAELSSEAKKAVFDFLDAPVSEVRRAPKTDSSPSWWGATRCFERAKPVIAHFAKAVTLMGARAPANSPRWSTNCIAGLLQGLSEGLTSPSRLAWTRKLVLDVISKGAGSPGRWKPRQDNGRRQVRLRLRCGWMRKDLRICSETARQTGAQLPVTQMIAGFYDEVSKMAAAAGYLRLIRRLRRA